MAERGDLYLSWDDLVALFAPEQEHEEILEELCAWTKTSIEGTVLSRDDGLFVETIGFEPTTPCVQGREKSGP